MVSLQTHLTLSTHRQLELIARAHGLPFTRREPKARGLSRLFKQLQTNALEHAFAGLTPAHLEALQALVVAGDWMPLPLFTAHFGEIRPYKPWRYPRRSYLTRDTNRHPWRYPISVAERLFHLGFIHIRDGEVVGIVAEIKAMLPALPKMQEVADRRPDASLNRQILLRDVAALLGVVMQRDLQPIHGRWFSLSALRIINAQLSQPDPELSGEHPPRSELQTGRLRWLHYLAQISGLLTVQAGCYKPTTAAWQWLSAPPDVQWSALMLAVERDLESVERVWDGFRFPDVTLETWLVVRHMLDDLAAGAVFRVQDFFQALVPYLLPDSRYDIACLLRDMFSWSHVVARYQGKFIISTPLKSTDSEQSDRLPTTIQRDGDRLQVSLPRKISPAYVRLFSFAQVREDRAIIHAESIKNGVRQGLSAADILHTLQQITRQPIPNDIQTLICQWVDAAEGLTLKPMLVLHVKDPQLLQHIRSDWRLAPHFAGRLSPHHLVVEAESADSLLQALDRRDIEVTSFLRPEMDHTTAPELTPDMAEYLLLAVRTYQKIDSRLDASIHIPNAISNWLAGNIHNPAYVERAADRMTQNIEKQVPASMPLTRDSLQDTPSVHRAIIRARQRGISLTIDYDSPYLDATSHRTIEIQDIYETGEITYIDAYCHLVNDTRTFRLDRIMRVYPPVADEFAV